MGWWFPLGILVGLALLGPLLVLATRRTERRVRALEKRARAAERLAELGTLTGGLAHEIKNPLSAVGMNIQLIQEDLRDLAADPTLQQACPRAAERLPRITRRADALWRETQRLRDILDDFLRFAGRMKLDLSPTDLNVLVGELCDFYEPQAQAAGVRLRTQPAGTPAFASADPALLKQALLNLMINATQALTEARERGQAVGGGDGGEIIIRLERVRPLDQDELHLHVIDTGPGIAPDKLDRVFQPYFSTKASGTGLGLPTARRIVEEHGGSLTVHSEVGRGSDFVIALPAAEPPDAPPRPAPAPAAAPEPRR